MSLGIWANVPDDSWVKVWVEGKPDEERHFTAAGAFQPATSQEHGELPDLDQGSRRRKLNSPTVYAILVTIDFADAKGSIATVAAEVTDPKGNPVPEALTQQGTWRSAEIQGDKGKASSKTVSLSLVTAGLSGGSK